MVRSILIVFFISLSAHADFLGFGGSDSPKNRLPDLVSKLKSLEMKVDPNYEEAFNKGVKDIENGIEEEKLYCSGEAVDEEGKTLSKEKKQLCMRELKKHYVVSMDAIYELKRKYLILIHQRQLQSLNEIQKKIKSDIEKNF